MVLCVVKGCDSKSKSYSSISFHRIPTKNKQQTNRWLAALNIDFQTPKESIKKWRVCSEHFEPDDFMDIMDRFTQNTVRRLKNTATPTIFTAHIRPSPMDDSPSEGPSLFEDAQAEGSYQEPVSDQDSQSADGSLEEEGEKYFADEVQRKQRSPRSCPGQRVHLQSKLILTVTNPSIEAHTSTLGTYFALPPTWPYQMKDPAEIGLLMNDDVNFNMNYISHSEGAVSPEKGDPQAQDTELRKGLVHCEHEKELEENEDSEIHTEDTAQCLDELMITKVEDFTNEMAVDQNEDCSERMDMDRTEDSGTRSITAVKSMDSSTLTIKDEPMDEEWKKAPQAPMGNIKDDEDFDQTPDDVKIQAAFSVGVNNSSIGPPVNVTGMAPSVPAEPLKWVGFICSACKKVVVKGLKVFQCSGSSDLFCSTKCLLSKKKKTCHSCLKEIDSSCVVIAPVDLSGNVKEFCSQKCCSASKFQCSVCQKKLVSHKHEVNYMGSIHKLCSESCFNQFRSSNKLNTNSCVNCGGYCYGTDSQCPSLKMEDKVLKFCSQNCLTAFKKRILTLITCKMCHTLRPAADALESPNSEGVRELFCSASCVTASETQTVSSSGVPVECNNCKLKLAPQYHISTSDGSVQNFCSYSCVLAFQVVSKTKPDKKEITLNFTSSNTSVSKPASSGSSSSNNNSAPSGQGQSVTKIPCSQCLNLFYHKPELLEFKRKMYSFCGNSCIEEFRKINIVIARCENCKNYKSVVVVRRINKTDCSFCSESCRSQFEHSTVKHWGKKHCRNCFHCNSLSKTVVTWTIDDKLEDFCGRNCALKHSSLIRQELKCAMCRQEKKMTESVKWLGDMKHFCSLRCLMFFCSLQGITGAQSKSLATQCANPVSSTGPQKTKEDTPVNANVSSLSSEQSGFMKNTDSKGSPPVSVTITLTGDKRDAKAPVSSQRLKTKDTQCKSTSKNKATSCKPHTSDAETQIDEAPKVIVLPVPVPVFVPVPMHLYSQYVPQSVGLPLPVPVPLFFPTTLDNAEHIVQTIQEIKEKIPDDPLEADLIMMAEMVAEDTEKDKSITSADQNGNVMEELDLEDLSSSLSWEEDSVSSAQTWTQTPESERPPPSRSDTLTPISTAAEEPQMDLEADFTVETIRLLREQMEKDSGKRTSCKRGHDVSQKKKGHKFASVPSNSLSRLQHEYGVSAWRDWIRWRNTQPNMDTPKFGSRSMTLKEDLLKCCTAELSYGLCKFISEVRRPNGDKYSPDSIFYLCLGIQQYLFENNRMENIFADVFYTKFSYEMSNLLKGWKPSILPSGYVHSRVEEEYLWECKQLGAFSPGVLLNTLLYFFTKYFNYRTVEQHRCLSFAKIRRYSRGPANSKVSFLRFYPPKADTSADGVPVKKRKKDQQRVLKIRQNVENPLRCPVKLYEFYLSKCTPGIRQDSSVFYLSPERYCVPSSPTWFSTSALSDEALDAMITRLLTVRELHLERDRSPDNSDSDSESDFSPF